MTETILKLPKSLRAELKEPLGPIFTETAPLLETAGSPLIAVGDVVTYHLIEAGVTPAVALVDERTERAAVDDEIAEALATYDGFARTATVDNPAATLSASLLETLRAAIDSDQTTLIEVNGEEDLATLPAALAVPQGASIVYGQPGEGMVLVTVDQDVTDRARDLLSRMDGDKEELWRLLHVE